MAKLAVIGAGAMGLAAAYHSLKLGHEVTVFEVDHVAGGMAAHFDLNGLSIERFYHFICKSDADTFGLLAELGIEDSLNWVDTSMGYYTHDQLYPWGDPFSLLRFPHLGLLSKLRYGLQMFMATRRKDWQQLDTVSAKQWILKGSGQEVYDELWKTLFDLKFYDYADDISAAWIERRVHRLGRSRKSMFQEQLGYLEGGSETLVNALVSAIHTQGGELRLAESVTEIMTENGQLKGVQTNQGLSPYDHVISTIPTPYVSAMIPGLSELLKSKYDAIKNIGVVCVVLKLKRSVSPHLWINVVDPQMQIPGLVEFSNLRPMSDTVVYVPFYMPTHLEKFRQSDNVYC